MSPVEPPPTPWRFPPVEARDEHGLVGVGGDLAPGTLLAAYRRGLFPMPVGGRGEIGWWSPDPRGILPLDGLRVTRSLRRSCRRFEVRVDTAFEAVIAGCADPDRPFGWITPAIIKAYTALHELGWAHSVEAWNRDTGRLAGGLYGIAIGGLYAGESMFHNETDASKAALVELVARLRDDAETVTGRLLDVQMQLPHMMSMGSVAIPADEYADRLRHALEVPLPALFAQPPSGRSASAV